MYYDFTYSQPPVLLPTSSKYLTICKFHQTPVDTSHPIRLYSTSEPPPSFLLHSSLTPPSLLFPSPQVPNDTVIAYNLSLRMICWRPYLFGLRCFDCPCCGQMVTRGRMMGHNEGHRKVVLSILWWIAWDENESKWRDECEILRGRTWGPIVKMFLLK